jgi:hypothetical protein
VARQLPRRRRADAKAGCELDLGADPRPDERCHRTVRTALAEERPLQLGVSALERIVVPVEATTSLGGRHEQPEQDRAEERIVLARIRPCVRPGEDRRRGLALKLLERDQRVLAAAQPPLARLDEAAYERAIFVQRRPVALDVLFERERKWLAVVHLAHQEGERAEDEAPERVVEMRRAGGHETHYGGGGASPSRWQRVHQ